LSVENKQEFIANIFLFIFNLLQHMVII
jgi:hypothetical protein